MKTKLYIGSELADYNEPFNVQFSIGDIRNPDLGNCNKTYTLNLPLTKINKRLVKFISQIDVKSELSAIGRLYIGELLIMAGPIKLTGNSDEFIKITISSDDWIDSLKNKKLSELDLSAYDHVLTKANIENSWTASYPFYRYPMINFGALASTETGLTARWFPNDFIPMFQVAGIINKILEPYTVYSSFLTSNAIKNIYILAREKIASDSFIQNKDLEANVDTNADNDNSIAATPGQTRQATITAQRMFFLDVVTDDAFGWTSPYSCYVIPETGTYRFTAVIATRNSAFLNEYFVILDEGVTVSLKQDRSSVITTLNTVTSGAYTIHELLEAVNYNLDSGYIHCEAGDEIYVELSCFCQATNQISGDTISVGTTSASNIVNVWNNVNKHSGLNKNISAEELLPDMTQVDFLSAIREIGNLKFWMDRMKRIIYIEPWDSLLSSTVVDITDVITHENPETDFISQYFSKITTLKWKDDTYDKAYEEYLKTAISPGMKDITLTSIYTDPDIRIKEHPFSSIMVGQNNTISSFSLATPRIWEDLIITAPIVFNRKVNFNTRIVKWDGLTAGLTWYLEGTTHNTYPKISGLDWASIYSSYLLKFYHYIDKGKIKTVRIKCSPLFLTQFFTTINSSIAEGFRPTYKIDNDYYFLQKITSDGEIAELELILKS